jgi:hypothetical protein
VAAYYSKKSVLNVTVADAAVRGYDEDGSDERQKDLLPPFGGRFECGEVAIVRRWTMAVKRWPSNWIEGQERPSVYKTKAITKRNILLFRNIKTMQVRADKS